MQWITGRDLYLNMPFWIMNAFYDTIMQDIKGLIDILELSSSIQNFDFEISKQNSRYTVKMYHDNLLLREYKALSGYLICYFEINSEDNRFWRIISNTKMSTALKHIWIN